MLDLRSKLDVRFSEGPLPSTAPGAEGRGITPTGVLTLGKSSSSLQRLENLFVVRSFWRTTRQPMTAIINVVTPFDQECHLGECNPRNHLKGENTIKQCKLWWEKVHSKKLPTV